MSKEQENIPPTPPIREKESSSSPSSPWRVPKEDIPLPAVIDIGTPPSLELAFSFAHKRLHCHDDQFLLEWYRQMSEVYFWMHPQTGQEIRHWPAYLRGSIHTHQRDLAEEKRKHSRAIRNARKPDNYLAPIKEESDVKPF